MTKSKAIKQLMMHFYFFVYLLRGKCCSSYFDILIPPLPNPLYLKHTFFKKTLELQVLPEPPSSLLVHFCSRRHAIHRHEEDLAGLDDPEEHLKIMEDVCKNLLLRNAKVDIFVIRVGALMNNPIHVQIEIVEFRNLKNNKQKTTLKILLVEVSASKTSTGQHRNKQSYEL